MQQIKNSKSCNPNATKEVKAVLNYLSDTVGTGIITGQHTQTRALEELTYIKEVTGKLPALCGFELLSYSPNLNEETCDEDCLTEIKENVGTLENAMDWALHEKGLVTLTWHWFSPMYSTNKGFYSANTTFDASKVLLEGTEERKAFFSDMDQMAEHLRRFADLNIPILWRPFHEAEGDWFWWGVKGLEVARELYRLMYDHYTRVHKLNHLIWVWNCPKIEGYVGDDVVDIISRDLYPEARVHTDLQTEYEELRKITPTNKLCAVAEIGTMPSVSKLSKSNIPWSYYMTWSREYGRTDKYTSKEELKEAYHHEYAITLDKLPKLY